MITGTSDYLKDSAETYHCPEHPDKGLTVAWHKDGFYVLRCGEGHYPEEMTRSKTPIEEYKAGNREAHAPLLSLLPKNDLATGELLAPEQTAALIKYAVHYDLDPFRGHVVLMYGKPYITIDGYLYHAKEENIPYQLRSRPLGQDERDAMMLGEKDHGWKSEITMPIGNQYFVGIGIVTQAEMTEKSKGKPDQPRSPVVAAHPWLMAQKRAEWQVLRRAFPIGESKEKE